MLAASQHAWHCEGNMGVGRRLKSYGGLDGACAVAEERITDCSVHKYVHIRVRLR